MSQDNPYGTPESYGTPEPHLHNEPEHQTQMLRPEPRAERNKGGSGDIRISTGDLGAYINPELILYVVAVIAMFIASAVVDQNDDGTGFGADRAWFYFVLLTVGYLISRGLAKCGRR